MFDETSAKHKFDAIAEGESRFLELITMSMTLIYIHILTKKKKKTKKNNKKQTLYSKQSVLKPIYFLQMNVTALRV